MQFYYLFSVFFPLVLITLFLLSFFGFLEHLLKIHLDLFTRLSSVSLCIILLEVAVSVTLYICDLIILSEMWKSYFHLDLFTFHDFKYNFHEYQIGFYFLLESVTMIVKFMTRIVYCMCAYFWLFPLLFLPSWCSQIPFFYNFLLFEELSSASL